MTAPPPGWYQDGSGTNRWWDGTKWTEHVNVPPPPPLVPIGPRPGNPMGFGWGHNFDPKGDARAGKNTAATSSLILGIFAVITIFIPPLNWLSVLTSIGAIVWGAIGLHRSRTSHVGKGLAISGLVTGIVVASLGVLGTIVLLSIG